jgi:hypothetical protein
MSRAPALERDQAPEEVRINTALELHLEHF